MYSHPIQQNQPLAFLFLAGRNQISSWPHEQQITGTKFKTNTIMQKYIYISLKHTHPKDKYFTLWNPDGRGYTIFFDQCGKYDKPHENNEDMDVGSIIEEDILHHIKLVTYEGKEHLMLCNNPATRETYDIKLTDLKAKHPYKFSKTE